MADHRAPHVIRHDPLTGVRAWCRVDDAGIIHTWLTQDPAPITDINKASHLDYAKAGGKRPNTQHHLRKIAEIPLGHYWAFVREMGSPRDFPEAWAARLNDPSFRDLRVEQGKISANDLRG